jgi:phosphoglycolate phosphatase-like HAD superfamily hydrolase
MEEPDFLSAALARPRTHLVLDLHNLHTVALNYGADPDEYLARLDLSKVIEIHVSGGSWSDPAWLPGGRSLRLDSHDGSTPDAVLGKPSPLMLDGVRKRHGMAANEIAVVGDRLYTDMAMARGAGALGVLVLSGETTAEQVERADPTPDLVVANIGELARMLPRRTEAASC